MKQKTRISEAMRDRGMTQEGVARLIGVSRQAVQRWSAGNPPTMENMKKLAEVLNVSVDYLLGEKPAPKITAVPTPDTKPLSGVVRVPVLSVAGGCSPAGEINDRQVIRGAIDFGTWFLESLKGVTSVNHFEVINASGDSMAPTIPPKSFLLIDRNQTDIRVDGVFCFRRESEIFIKRIQRNLDGTLFLLSDNPLYEPIKVRRDELEFSSIVGRVVYCFKGQDI